MTLMHVPIGRNVPDDFNVIIEIPANSDPIKYEIDKETGAMMVDRFMSTSMRYPCDYGYIPGTLSKDGDPVDVLVVTPFPLIPESVVRCRPIGMLKMADESGIDMKILAVPVTELTPLYEGVERPDDLPKLLLSQIAHFFEHYKDLDANKWVELEGWEDGEAAREEILDGKQRYEASTEHMAF